MIQVENVTLAFGGETLLEEVGFTIGRGERCGFVGRNGSGKTTLLRLLMGREEPDRGVITTAKGYKLGYLDQHIRFSADSILEEACLGLPPEERDSVYKAEKLLFGLGFREFDLEGPTTELSGGFQLRLHLTKLLLSEPNCLLLDEPTNYLDILSMRFLAKMLSRWDGEFVIISHDREFMDSITTHTLGIHRKKVRKVVGSSIDFFNQVVEEEKIYEQTKMNLDKKKAHLQSFIDRFGAKATKAGQAQSRKKMLDRIPSLEALASLHDLDFNFREKTFSGKKIGEIRNISFSYDTPLIQNFSLDIEKGDRIGIIGKNGYGKSTLLRLLEGELKPQQGSIEYSEMVSIGYFGQTNIQRLLDQKTIEEEISTSNPKLNYSEIRGICGQMMFSGDAAKKKIAVLSGGEKSRVLLGKILGKPSNLLLLDEPTHHLDIESVEALTDALETFSEAFIIVTHSELILKRLRLDKLIVCHRDKQQFFLGGYEEFLEKSGWEEERPPGKEAKKAKPAPLDQDARKQVEKEIRKIEAEIMQLEEVQTKELELLVKASQSREVSKIQKFSASTKEREANILTLYTHLTKLIDSIPRVTQE